MCTNPVIQEEPEKRKLERYNLALPARIDSINGQPIKDQDQEFTMVTSDVCAGGAFFKTDAPLAEGTQVSLDLILSIEDLKKLKGKEALIRLNGKVVRSETGGMAVCFDQHYRMQTISV